MSFRYELLKRLVKAAGIDQGRAAGTLDAGELDRLEKLLTGWTLPAVLDKPITHLANMVPPLGFLTLGGILTFSGVRANRKALTFITIVKLLIIPAVMTGIAVALGFRELRLLTILLIFAAPTAMASYPLANALGSDAELAGEAVAVTTAFSLPTVFLFLTFFGGLLWHLKELK